MLDKSSRISRIESWSPDGKYIAVSVGVSIPGLPSRDDSQRIWVLDPVTKSVTPVDTGALYIEFLAWLVP